MHARTLALAVDLGGTKVDAALVDDAGTSSQARCTGRRRVGMPHATTSLEAIARVAADALSSSPRRRPADRHRDRLRRAGRSGERHDRPAQPAGAGGAADRLARRRPASRCTGAAGARRHLHRPCRALARRRGRHPQRPGHGRLHRRGRRAHHRRPPVTGLSGNAGHIGQLRLRERAAGSPMTDGTLEALASGPSAVAWARAAGWTGSTGEELVGVICRRRSPRRRCGAPLGRRGRRGHRECRDPARPGCRRRRRRLRPGLDRLPRPRARGRRPKPRSSNTPAGCGFRHPVSTGTAR